MLPSTRSFPECIELSIKSAVVNRDAPGSSYRYPISRASPPPRPPLSSPHPHLIEWRSEWRKYTPSATLSITYLMIYTLAPREHSDVVTTWCVETAKPLQAALSVEFPAFLRPLKCTLFLWVKAYIWMKILLTCWCQKFSSWAYVGSVWESVLFWCELQGFNYDSTSTKQARVFDWLKVWCWF